MNEALSAVERDLAVLYYAPIGRPRSRRRCCFERCCCRHTIRSTPSATADGADRLLEGDIAASSWQCAGGAAGEEKSASTDHFSVGRTLIEAWASMKPPASIPVVDLSGRARWHHRGAPGAASPFDSSTRIRPKGSTRAIVAARNSHRLWRPLSGSAGRLAPAEVARPLSAGPHVDGELPRWHRLGDFGIGCFDRRVCVDPRV